MHQGRVLPFREAGGPGKKRHTKLELQQSADESIFPLN